MYSSNCKKQGSFHPRIMRDCFKRLYKREKRRKQARNNVRDQISVLERSCVSSNRDVRFILLAQKDRVTFDNPTFTNKIHFQQIQK